jgi:uncharacterized SAM-dependent methyltransferase
MTKYNKNSDIIRLYNVSDKAVRNWIENALAGKNTLDLISEAGRTYIVDNPHNTAEIQTLVERGRKYRNQKTYRSVSPTSEFYDRYSPDQIVDIINYIEKYNEIPSHYRYFGRGARLWDQYLNKLYESPRRNLMNTTHELVRLDMVYLEMLTEQYEQINLIDLGVGNGVGAKPIIKQLLQSGSLGKYIGVDCSKELLNLSMSNIKKWFDGEVTTESYLRDITYERFDELLRANESNGKVLNIVLFLGGTIGNFRDPKQALITIRDSIGKDDILITSDELDSENARLFDGFRIGVKSEEDVITRNTLLLGLMGINRSMYELEQFFDDSLKCRITQIKLKVELTINFDYKGLSTATSLPKGACLVLFRMWEWTGHELEGMYENCGFSQVRTTRLHDPEYVLMISRVTSGPVTKQPSKI